jgi:V8-like Glu-specific endopeptidase
VWSDAIRGGAKSVILTRERADSRCPSVRISGLLIDAVQSSPSSIIKPDDLRPLLSQQSVLIQRNIDPAQTTAWAKSIARLRYVSDLDGFGYFCTGFLVTPRLLLTNEHCLRTQSEARSAEADFDFDSDAAPPQTIRVKSLVRASFELDYALVELRKTTTGRTPLTLAAVSYMPKPEMVIVQHPSGKVKHASIVDCLADRNDVAGTTESHTDFTHRCDTEGGSSGSPVHHLASGHVVGLHHFGVPEDEPNGRNQAVKITDVLNDLQKPAVRKEIASRHSHLANEIQAFVDAALARQ